MSENEAGSESEASPTGAGDEAATAVLPPPPVGEPVDDGPQQVSPTTLVQRDDKPVISVAEVGLVLLAAFIGNIALRTTLGGLGAAMAAAVAVVLVARRTRQRNAVVALAMATALIPWLFIRSSVYLTLITVVAIAALLLVAAGFSIRGSMFDAHVRTFAAHVGSVVYEWLYGFAMVRRLLQGATASKRLTPILRGVAVAVPVLIVFTTLLATADEVFAKLLLLDNLPQLIGHLILTAIVSIAFFALLSRAAHETEGDRANWIDLRTVGPVEVTIILGSLLVLFAAFVATQVVIAVGGAEYVFDTEGLSQADHARRGFFQLVWVSGLALLLVGGLRAGRKLDPDSGKDRFVPLALGTLALTLVIAMVSVQRLAGYVDVFGLTQLRLWALAGVAAIALAIVTFAVSITGVRSDQAWFPGAMVVLVAGFVFALNVLNPDAVVAEYNLSRGPLAEVDLSVITQLSDDAVPAMVERANEPGAAQLQAELCGRADRFQSYGFFNYNWSEVRADNKLDALCGPRIGRSDWFD